jgi:arsenical pump membrane protein
VSGCRTRELLARGVPILGFLICITVVAEPADRLGVFSLLAHVAARADRGSVLGLWLLVVALATVATAVLSLDTTAVLLTPVVLVLAAHLGPDRRLFAYPTVWLAKYRLALPAVSDLTNLLSLSTLAAWGCHPIPVASPR